MKRTTMQVSNGKGPKAIGVEVTLDVPANDAEWRKRYNLSPAERDAKALRQVRVDIANGGARDTLREGIKKGLKGAELKAHVQKFVDDWRSGTRTTKVPVMDLRNIPLGAEQLVAIQTENEGYHFLLTEDQQKAIDAYNEHNKK